MDSLRRFLCFILLWLPLTTVAQGAKTNTPASAAADLPGTRDTSIKEIVRLVARRQLQQLGSLRDGDYAPVDSLEAAKAARAPTGIGWDYPWGVTLYGVIRSFDVTADQEMLDWALEHNRIVARYLAWLETVHREEGDTENWKQFARSLSISRLLRLGNLDNCGAMGVQFIEGIMRHPDSAIPEQSRVLDRIAEWISEKEARLPDGTFWRPTSKDKSEQWPNGTIWADDLYMSCPYLVRWGSYTGNRKHLTDAAHQIINMADRLQDKDGVWFHAYCEPINEHSPFKWARANGWVMIATVEVLSALPEDHPDRSSLMKIYRRHVAGIKKHQPISGVWHNIVDRTDIWEETSSTLMFAYAIARGVNRGWLPPADMAVARKAFAAVSSDYITPQGGLNGTVQGTGIGTTFEYYASRERPDDDLHGRGIVLLAGTEILRRRP